MAKKTSRPPWVGRPTAPLIKRGEDCKRLATARTGRFLKLFWALWTRGNSAASPDGHHPLQKPEAARVARNGAPADNGGVPRVRGTTRGATATQRRGFPVTPAPLPSLPAGRRMRSTSGSAAARPEDCRSPLFRAGLARVNRPALPSRWAAGMELKPPPCPRMRRVGPCNASTSDGRQRRVAIMGQPKGGQHA